MKPILLFLTLIAECLGGQDVVDQTSLNRTVVINLLQKLCPGADVCREYKTINTPNVTFKYGFESCCTDCSCAPDCVKNGTCCFPDDFQDPISELPSHIQSSCVIVSTSMENDENRILKAFNMITSVQHSNSDESSSNQYCGDKNVAPWGSLYPVYSPKRKRIYKNNACALADQVDDGKLWDAILVCNKIFYDLSNLSGGCRVDFIYTGPSKDDLEALQCFDYLTTTCSTSAYRIPKDIQPYGYEVIADACSSGLVSPFRIFSQEQYTNVFCYICNGARFPDDILERQNQRLNEEKKLFGIEGNFVGLVDFRFVQNFVEDQKSTIQACTDQKNGKCRSLLCPYGNIRDHTGKCTFINTAWYNQNFYITLKLTTSTPIDIKDMFLYENNNTKDRPPEYTSHWKQPWTVMEFRCFQEDFELGKTKTLIMYLSAHFTEVDPRYFFEDIETYLGRRKFYIKSSGQTYSFNTTFCEDGAYHPRNTVMVIRNDAKAIYKDATSLLYFRNFYPDNSFLITKLYLCNQVELHQSEFILSEDEAFLYNMFTKTILYSNEFMLLTNAAGNVYARVCIEDSGLYMVNHFQNSLGNFMSAGKSGLTLTIAILTWFLGYKSC